MPEPTMADAARTRAARREREVDAEDALSRIHGAQGLQATALALLLPLDNPSSLRAWETETADMPGSNALRAHAQALSGATRLPWLERLTVRMRAQPIGTRRSFLMATRRLMSARGSIHPLDRLHWLALRQWLGEPSAVKEHAAATGDLEEMEPGDVQAVARFSAFLSRMVPGEVVGRSAAHAWYAAVMTPWQDQPEAAYEQPDADGMVTSLLALQSLAWMQRPMLLRAWVDAALASGRPPNRRQPALGASGLHDDAADALRLAGELLDSPLPPELAHHFREPKEDHR